MASPSQNNEIDNLIIAAATASGDPEAEFPHETSNTDTFELHKPGFWGPVLLQTEHINAIRDASKLVCESREDRPFLPEPYGRKQGSEHVYQEMTELMDFQGGSDHPERVALMRKHSMIFRPSGPNSRALTLYEQAVNEAAAQIAFEFPAAIYHKRELAIMAKQAVRFTGFEFPNARSGYYPPGSILPNKMSDDSSDYPESGGTTATSMVLQPMQATPASASVALQKSISHRMQHGKMGGVGYSSDVVQIRLQGDVFADSDAYNSMIHSGVQPPYYMDPSGGGGADSNPMTLGSGPVGVTTSLISFDDELACPGLDSSELVQLLGGSQAISQLSDTQLEELGRAQFTIVDPRMDLEMANCPLSLSVEEDDRPLDEAEILRLTHAKALDRVRVLSVPASGYTSINATHLARCVNLVELDLSENALRVFPRRLHLPNLQRLSITGNRFIHLPLIEQFPSLIKLNIDDKLKHLLNPQMLAYFCPKLRIISQQQFEEPRVDFTMRIMQEAKSITEPHIRAKWELDYADRPLSIRTHIDRLQLVDQFVQYLKERNLLLDEALIKYKDLLFFRMVDEFLHTKLRDSHDAGLGGSQEVKEDKQINETGEFSADELLAETAIADGTTKSQEQEQQPSDVSTTMLATETDSGKEEWLCDPEDEQDLELRIATERALLDATDEVLGTYLPDPATISQAPATGQVQTTLVVDAMGRLHPQQVVVATPPGYGSQYLVPSNHFHLARSLRQGRSVVMTVIRPRGVSGRPVAEFLPGELRNKDYVKGYMASEIYKKAVKDTLGQKITPKKRPGANRVRRPDTVSGSPVPLSEVNGSTGAKKPNLGRGRYVKDGYDVSEEQSADGGASNLPPRPKKRKGLGAHSLRDLCAESSFTTEDPYNTVGTGSGGAGATGPRSDSTPIDYDPLHFIRCHAKDNDAGDSETKVWRCLFEPNPLRPEETTHVVATCGGECVCLINCETGKVMKRFKHMEEEFYTIAWTTVEVETGKSTNILAAAGRMREIRLLHPEQLVCYAEMKGHTEDITAMIFHQSQSTILFSGDSKASVIVWDIGIPSVPDYKTRYQLLMRLRCPRLDVNPVLNLVFLSHYAYLIAGCEDGLFAWKVTDLRLEKREREPDMELKLDFPHEVCIDGLSQLSENSLVIKVVESGEIMVFDFASVLERRKGLQRIVPIEMRGHLLWQKTDEIYINVSVRQNLGAVLCGDNEGSIWIYDLDPYLDDLHASSRKKFHVKPIKILEWPECSVQGNCDEDQQLKESISSGFRNPVVNSVEMSSDGYYLAAVTDNNLVCIWRYAPPQQPAPPTQAHSTTGVRLTSNQASTSSAAALANTTLQNLTESSQTDMVPIAANGIHADGTSDEYAPIEAVS